MGYYNELSMEPLERSRNAQPLPGDKVYNPAIHTARISYQRGWAADGWQERYFVSQSEARRARHTFIRADYRIVIMCRIGDRWED